MCSDRPHAKYYEGNKRPLKSHSFALFAISFGR